MIIKKYYPKFFDGFEDEYCEVDDINDIPWLSTWKSDPSFKGVYVIDHTCVMVDVGEKGKYVVGTIVDKIKEKSEDNNTLVIGKTKKDDNDPKRIVTIKLGK